MSTDLQHTPRDEVEDPSEPGVAATLAKNEPAPRSEKDAESGLVVDQQDGITRMEAFYLVFSKGWKIWILYGSLATISIVYALSQSTTSTYELFAASSFESHSLIATISVVASIAGGVARPFVAKIADIWSRPMALAVSVSMYAVGYIVVASSTTINAVAGGEVIYGIGNTGIDMITSIIVADITSLQWRGFMQALYSSPFIITAFVAGNISTAISANTLTGWRWGYGMFVILVPISIAPALIVLFWANRKAEKIGALSLASSSYARRKQLDGKPAQSLLHLGSYYWRLLDGFGLLLLGSAFTLTLLPLTIYTKIHNGWKNPAIIAMFVVGGVLLIIFGIWELKGAAHPIMPRRVMNRTLLCCLAIDTMYFLSSNVTITYFSSYVYVVKDWSLANYTYFNNISLVGLCVFAILAGLIQRATHRYKYLQLCGLGIRIIGQGLTLLAARGNKGDAVLVLSQLLIALGGAFSTIGSQVAAQASVPHQDLALVSSLIALWAYLGGAIGSAIAGAIWTTNLPQNLTKYLGESLNTTEIAGIYGSILVARVAEPRELVIQAYDDTAYAIFLPALCLSSLSIVAGLFTTNFYLGTTHNAVEAKEVRLRGESELAEEERVERSEEAEKVGA
ncbi:major facilitator superfamily domain-containing protein [Mycena filopes]|nr:major facilitator superfamily domain-containing protein [Mycena filopes]